MIAFAVRGHANCLGAVMLSRTRCLVLLTASLLACGGQIELTADAPPPPSPPSRSVPNVDPAPVAPPTPPGDLKPMWTDIDDPLAQAICNDVAMYQSSGSFDADDFFGLRDASSVSASLDQYQPADSPHGYSGVTLNFHVPAQHGDDAVHGAWLGESAHLLRLGIVGAYPTIDPGTYDHESILKLERRSLCFSDAVGASSEEPVIGGEISEATIVITAYTPSTIEGTITTQDGAHRLDFKAPLRAAGYPKEGPLCCLGNALPPGAPPKLAPSCASKPAGTFTADPAFGFAAGTKLETYLDQRYLDDANRGVLLRLELRSPPSSAQDQYGETLRRHRTTITVPLETPYPTIPPGAYTASTWAGEEEEACYPNGLGYATAVPNNDRAPEDTKLTITSQTATHIAGTLEIGGKRLAFDTPITPTPADVPTHPDCCRE
jgi:hypothetical protein